MKKKLGLLSIIVITLIFAVALAACDTGDDSRTHAHTWGTWEQVTAPTCTEDGWEQRVCSGDSTHTETRDIPALGHSWGNWITTLEPTADTAGSKTRTCSRADCTHTETEIIPATGDGMQDQEFTGVTFENKTVTYNGESHSVIVTGAPQGTDIQYTNNTGTNASVYNASATLTKNGYTKTLTAVLTINNATITGVTFTNATVAADGSNKNITVSGVIPVGVTVAYTVNDIAFTGASTTGTYNIKAVLSGTNYNTLTLNATLTIRPTELPQIDVSTLSWDADSRILSWEIPSDIAHATQTRIMIANEAGTQLLLAETFTNNAFIQLPYDVGNGDVSMLLQLLPRTDFAYLYFEGQPAFIMFFELLPNLPELATVASINYNDDTKVVSWTPVAGAIGYRLSVNGAGIATTITNQTVSDPTFTLTDMRNGTITVTVIALGNNITSIRSQAKTASFTVTDKPAFTLAPVWNRLSAGENHTLAIDSEGGLWAWGRNNGGKLGDGTTINRDLPVQIMPERKFAMVSAGGNHSAAIDSEGGLWTWGDNTSGQLGIGVSSLAGPNSFRLTPTKVTVQELPNLKFASVSTGASHTLAIDADGGLWAWGLNSNGQLGDASTTNRNSPVRALSHPDLPAREFDFVSAADVHSAAIDTDGNLITWGTPAVYELLGEGNETRFGQNNYYIQIHVMPTKQFKAVSASGSHMLAIESNGDLWAWGRPDYETVNPSSVTPVFIGANFSLISSSGYQNSPGHNLLIDTDGNLWAWGRDNYGQLGVGGTSTVFNLVQVATGTEFLIAAAGGVHSAAIDAAGKLWTWGNNVMGELGDGTNDNSSTPIHILQSVVFFYC
ncbi:MAG: hypothetical protein FWH03_04645 [Firmicutes bacterium]|nr:hypothetical protein [Bacillota bacterium]